MKEEFVMLSLLLLDNIAQLFLMLLGGYLLVKLHILKPEDSKCLSSVILFLVNPCVCIQAFQVDRTPQIVQIMLLMGAFAIFAHIVLILFSKLLSRPARLNHVERASIIYTNCGNLMIPLVMNLMDTQALAYLNVYNMIYIFMVWSHGRMLLSGEKSFSIKKILLNCNIIAATGGIVLFWLQIRLPETVAGAMSSLMNLAGPISMIVTGMLLGGIDLKKVFRTPGVWKVTFLRMIVCPLLFVLLFRLMNLETLVPGCTQAVLICLLVVSAPSATNVTHISLLYGGGTENSEYASAINTVTTICCIATIPLMVALYQL